MGSYFDMYEFETVPIKPIINTYFYNMASYLSNNQNYNIKRNNATTKDN
jgi:hypothetical protein